ncbi:hypothetical protein ACLEX4_21035 [Pseudescherichia vulneris]
MTVYADTSALLVKKSDLARHFADDGRLTGAVTLVVKGEVNTALAAFDEQSFQYSADDTGDGHALLTLLPA